MRYLGMDGSEDKMPPCFEEGSRSLTRGFVINPKTCTNKWISMSISCHFFFSKKQNKVIIIGPIVIYVISFSLLTSQIMSFL